MARSEEFINGAYRIPSYSTDEYISGKGESALGTQSGARITIEHPETSYESDGDFSPSRKINAAGDDYERDVDNRPIRENWLEHNNVQPGEQIPLFKVDHKPPVLNYMVATKDARAEGASLAAHAAEETRRRFGERPWASSSTSEHSTAMTNEAIEAGIVPGVIGKAPGERATVSNNYDWMNSITGMNDARGTYEMAKGRTRSPIELDPKLMSIDKTNIAKEAIANKRANRAATRIGNKSSQFDGVSKDQLTLPGL